MELIAIDTTGIQAYIFGSNRLQENIGASYLVNQAIREWVLDTTPAPNNIKPEDERKNPEDWDNGAKIEKDNLAAEVLYMGGGNAVLLLQNKSVASKFTYAYTRHVLRHAPGLSVVLAQRPFDWHKESLYDAMNEMFETILPDKKQGRVHSNPLLGLGVTLRCQSTGLPARTLSKPIGGERISYAISAAIEAKRCNIGAANEYLAAQLPPPPGYEYPHNFDKIGRSDGDQSYLAVAHLDGDSMGKRFQKYGRKYKNKTYNRKFIAMRRDFSNKLRQSAREALNRILKALDNNITHASRRPRIEHWMGNGEQVAEVVFRRADKKDVYYLPFRPIVFGGDDVTFVCDGRLGLSLAVAYMDAFEQVTKDTLKKYGGKSSSSGGVAIVKSHYPFARAYGLAEALGKQAKRYRRQLFTDEKGDPITDEKGNPIGGACLDWHFALGSVLGDLKTMRQREYCVDLSQKVGSLTMRPVTRANNPSSDSFRAWDTVANGIRHFQGTEWAGKRNKVKALRDALREGGDAVEKFRLLYNLTQLPDIGHSAFRESGWQGEDFCAYFDALELADWFIPLTK